MCMKKYYLNKIFLTKLQLFELRQHCSCLNLDNIDNFYEHLLIRADQLIPQFLLELFDTLPSQYRHTGHVHEEILF